MTVSWFGVHNNMNQDGEVDLYKLDNAHVWADMNNNAITAIHFEGDTVAPGKKKKGQNVKTETIDKDAASECKFMDEEVGFSLDIPVNGAVETLVLNAICSVVGDSVWFASVQIVRRVESDKATFNPYPMDGLCAFESFLEPLPNRALRTARTLLETPPHIRTPRSVADCSWKPVCACSAPCTVRGDPHVVDFTGEDEWIMADDAYIVLYRKDDFVVKAFSATEWAYVKRIYWGDDDVLDADTVCKNRKSSFVRVHTFDDGNVVEAVFNCEIKRAGKKNPRDSEGYYFNTKLVKHNKVDLSNTFFDSEDDQDTGGLCTDVHVM